MTARENEVELLTIKFYNLHIVSVEKFHEESVCHKVEEVPLRFVQIQHLQAIQQNRHILPSVVPLPSGVTRVFGARGQKQ